LIAVLAVKVEDIFDGPEVTVFVLLSGCVFDVVGKLVFTSGCDGCAGIGASALKRWSPLP